MRLTRTDDQLQLHDQSAAFIVLGGCFALIGGTFVCGALGGFRNADQLSAAERAITLLIGGGGATAGVVVALGTVRRRVRLHRDRRELELHERRWLRSTRRRISSADVAALRVIRRTDSDGDHVHGLLLVLRSGEELPLVEPDATDLPTTAALARTLALEAGYALELPAPDPAAAIK